MVATASREEVRSALEEVRAAMGFEQVGDDGEHGAVTLLEPTGKWTWSHEIRAHVIEGVGDEVFVHVESLRADLPFVVFTEILDFHTKQERAILEAIAEQLGPERCKVL